MKHKFFIATSAAILPLAAAMCCAERSVKAEANSAPPYWEGTTASGAIVKGDDCPVVVEKEVLTLNIKDLPRGGMLEQDSYAAEAIAEYSFYNPTDLNVDMTLLFPFGVFPSYVPENANDEVSAVTVDGERAECKVRYSYADYEFDTDRDMARVRDGMTEDSFYREDLPVREYSISLNAVETPQSCMMKIKLGFNPKKTRVLFPSDSCARLTVSDGDMYAYTSNGSAGLKSAVCYVVGEPLSELAPKLYSEEQEISAYSSVTQKDMSFSEFVYMMRGEESDVGDLDWYNAFVDMLNHSKGAGGSVDCFALRESELMRWYEYKMTIPAGGRANNRVRAPLYPTVDGRNPRYEYTYLLSPAGKWAEFQEIEIRLETPYHLSSSALEFSKTEKEDGTGFTYYYTRKSLPQGELTFVLTEGDAPNNDFSIFGKGKNFLLPTLTWAFIALVVLAVVAAVVTVIVVFSLRKKKKK